MKPWIPAGILLTAALIFLAWPLTTSQVLLPAAHLYSTVPVDNLDKGPVQNLRRVPKLMTRTHNGCRRPPETL